MKQLNYCLVSFFTILLLISSACLVLSSSIENGNMPKLPTKDDLISERIINEKVNISGDSTLRPKYAYKDRFTQVADSLEKKENTAVYLEYLQKLGDKYAGNNNNEGEIYVFTALGIHYYINSQFDTALTFFERGKEKCLNYFGALHPALSEIYYYEGQCYFYKGDFENSQSIQLAALEGWQAYYGKQKSTELSNSYRALGNVYQYLSADYFNAEKMYSKAVGIIESPFLEVSEEQKFKIYYNLGVCNREKNDFEKAYTFGNKALKILENKDTKDTRFLELCYAMNANTLIRLDSLEAAIKMLEKVLSINSINFSTSPNDYLVQHLNNLGFAYLKKGSTVTAEDYFLKGLKISEQLQSNDNTLNQSYIYENLGNLYKSNKHYSQAFKACEKSLQYRKRLFGIKHNLVGEAYKFYGQLYQDKQDFESALLMYQEALIASIPDYKDSSIYHFPSKIQLQNNVKLIELINNKSQSLLKLHRFNKDIKALKAALKGFNLADSLTLSFQDIFPRETTKFRFIDLMHDIYEGGIEAAYTLHQLEKDSKYVKTAFCLIENSKARILNDAFYKAQSVNRVGLPDSIIQAENEINMKIAYYQSKNVIGEVQEKLFELDREKQLLIFNIKNNYPKYFVKKYDNTTIPINQIQGYLNKNDQVLLSYFVGKEHIFLAIINGKEIGIKRLQKGIRSSISIFYKQLQNGYNFTNKHEIYQQFIEAACELYETLIKPAQHYFSSKSNILIVPDDVLSFIPFEALLTTQVKDNEQINYKTLPYLIKKYDIQYIYSSKLLLYNSQKKNMQIPNNPKVLAYSYSKHREKGNIALVRKMLATIPGAPVELDAIQQFFSGGFFYGEEATEFSFKKNAENNYDILHLAVHGTADSDNNYGAYLQFRQDNKVDNENRLYNFELYNMNLKAKLAVLSACESGVGKSNKGEGLLSIGRGFAYAGCPTTMMSLWQVNDKATADIITSFYENLESGYSVNHSLRNAKLSYLKKSDEITAHPAYWAPMIVYGEDIEIDKNSYAYFLALFLVIVGSITWICFKKSINK